MGEINNLKKGQDISDAPEPTKVDMMLTEEEESDIDDYDVEPEEEEDSKARVSGLQQYLFDVAVAQKAASIKRGRAVTWTDEGCRR